MDFEREVEGVGYGGVGNVVVSGKQGEHVAGLGMIGGARWTDAAAGYHKIVGRAHTSDRFDDG